jgi:hypothetical protein
MTKLIDIINEGKQVGILYHFTDINSAIKILRFNILASMGYNRISFTRNKGFLKDNPFASGWSGGDEVMIVVDGDKLSNRYKIRPFAGLNFQNDNSNLPSDEMEEVIESPRIENIIDYIIKIVINMKVLKQKHEDFSIPNSVIKWNVDELKAEARNENVKLEIYKGK